MPDVLAIVSKAVFEKETKAAQLGDIYETSVYRSKNKRLGCLSEGGTLYLVTVRPGDLLWVVAQFENPVLTEDGWSGTNVAAIHDITHVVPRLQLDTGKGIAAKPGRLGMSLQTPRLLSAQDSVLLGGQTPAIVREPPVSLPSPPRSHKERSAPAANREKTQSGSGGSPTQREPLESILQEELGRATQRLIRLAAESDGSEIDALVGWVTEETTWLWRSFKAKEFWFHLLYYVLLHSEERHLEILRKPPAPESRQVLNHLSSQMDHWVVRNRERVTQWIEFRLSMNRESDFVDEPFPKKKAAIAAYIAMRIGSPKWNESKALTSIAQKSRLSLTDEEGLHILAALLLHGETSDLEKLEGKAQTDPILAQLLAARGIALAESTDGSALMDLVFAAPQDDAPRWVLSDFLMEQDDPWGEFIRAQLSGETPKLTAKLRKRYADKLREHIKWTGAHVDFDNLPVQFDRGLVHACTIASFDGKSQHDRGWSALEIVDVTKSIESIAEYSLPSLRFIGGVQAKQLEVLLRSPVASQLIGLSLSRVLKAEQGEVWHLVSKFPKLRFLGLGQRAYDESIHDHPLMERIDTMWVPARRDGPKCTPGNWDGYWMPEYRALMRKWRALA